MRLLEKLKRYEEGDFTFIEGDFPPVLCGAEGIRVVDCEGKEYIDLTSFFGVSILGHSPEFVKKETERGFFHGMGDLLPSREKIELLESLSNLLGGEWKGILLQNGSDAVEACLRTAYLLTGKKRIIAFEGAYHGAGLGALSATYGKRFREKFEEVLPMKAVFFPFSEKSLKGIEKAVKEGNVAGIIIEPVQGRAGIKFASPRLLKGLRKIADSYRVPLIFDEIYTGFYKTGKPFAKDFFGVEPDMIALGKALSASFPISACMGKEWIMDVWGKSNGEASYTYTFSGNPFFCRVALAALREYENIRAREKAEEIGAWIDELSRPLIEKGFVRERRGVGILWGFDIGEPGAGYKAFRFLLDRGWITLPSGLKGEVLEIIPPLIVDRKTIEEFFLILKDLKFFLTGS